MKKKTIIVVILSMAALILTCGIIFVSVSYARGASDIDVTSDAAISPTPEARGNRGDDYTYIPPTEVKDNPKPIPTEAEPEETFVPATEMDLDPSSITVFVNKEHALPKDYKPAELVIPNIYFDLTYYDERTMMRPEAAAAIEKLFTAAKNAGYQLCGVSGYRSYTRQKKIFTENILTKGKAHTLQYSAVPGTSEHQTGLAMDLSCASLKFDLSSTFAKTPEGIWLADNAYRFGFTIRYPEGKADITGYAYEPWHIRYVGKGLAKYLYDNDLTLDEYYKYTPSKDFDFLTLYADLINITPAPTDFPLDGEGFVLGENGEIIEGELGNAANPTDKGGATKDDTKGGKPDSLSPTPTIAPQVTSTPTIAPQVTPTPTIAPQVTSTPTIAPANGGRNGDGTTTDPGNNTGTGDTSQTGDNTGTEVTPTISADISTNIQ